MCTYGGGRGEKLRPLVEYNEPGKIMLIETPDGKAAKISACWGPLESARAKALQAEGVIVSGNVRQLSQCQEVGLPVSTKQCRSHLLFFFCSFHFLFSLLVVSLSYSPIPFHPSTALRTKCLLTPDPTRQLFYRGTAPLGPRQYMRLAKVNEPIHIGGTDIFADNIILADEDGVVVVHPRLIAEVLSACDKAAKRQAVLRRAIDEGKSMEVAQVEEHDFLAGLKKAESLFKW